MSIKHCIKSMQYLCEDAIYTDSLRVDWVRENNFGDILNPLVASYISGKKILHVNPDYYTKDYISAIGSICGRARENTTIWGSGFISKDSTFKSKPKEIKALRGPKSRQLAMKQGVKAPEIYGDPALLIPRFYNPNKEKKFKIGLVPHYVDYNEPFFRQCNKREDVKLINLINPNPLEVIDEILECEIILSTSLHGLIIADAYGIKSKWVKVSDKLVGGEFKFLDYYESLTVKNETPYEIGKSFYLNDVADKAYAKELTLDLDLLLSVSPYLS